MTIKYFKSKSFLVPTILYLLFLIVFILIFQTGEIKYTSFTRMLTQWDGQHYLTIARDGYNVEPCTNRVSTICGNVGWFPGYPLVAFLLSWLPFNIQYILIGVSWLAFWLALLLLFHLAEKMHNQKVAIATILVLMVFPTSFYFLTVFPYSIFLLTVLFIFKQFFEYKFFLLVPLCGLLAIMYPSGIIIILPLIYFLIRKRKELSKPTLFYVISSVISVGLALFLYCLYNYFVFDNFFLYTDFQSQWFYAHKAAFPLYVLFTDISTMQYQHPVWIMLVFVTIITALFFHKRLNIYLLIYMFGILLFTPAAGTTDCYYRHILVAFPFFMMIATSIEKKRLRYFLPLYFIVCFYYMLTVYLPYYKNGQLM